MNKLNEIIFGEKESGPLKLDHLIMSHTVFEDELLLNRYRNKFVLVESSAPNCVEIVQNYGYKKIISLKELMVLYPTISPLLP